MKSELLVTCELGVSVSVGVIPMMQLTGNLFGVLCPLHAEIELTCRDSMMVYSSRVVIM